MFFITVVICLALPIAGMYTKEPSPEVVGNKYISGLIKAGKMIIYGDENGHCEGKPIWPLILFTFLLRLMPTASIVYNYVYVAENVTSWEMNIINLISSCTCVLSVWLYGKCFLKAKFWAVYIISLIVIPNYSNCKCCYSMLTNSFPY